MIGFIINWFIFFIVVAIYIFVFALCKAASDADKQLDCLDINEVTHNNEEIN